MLYNDVSFWAKMTHHDVNVAVHVGGIGGPRPDSTVCTTGGDDVEVRGGADAPDALALVAAVPEREIAVGKRQNQTSGSV